MNMFIPIGHRVVVEFSHYSEKHCVIFARWDSDSETKLVARTSMLVRHLIGRTGIVARMFGPDQRRWETRTHTPVFPYNSYAIRLDKPVVRKGDLTEYWIAVVEENHLTCEGECDLETLLTSDIARLRECGLERLSKTCQQN